MIPRLCFVEVLVITLLATWAACGSGCAPQMTGARSARGSDSAPRFEATHIPTDGIRTEVYGLADTYMSMALQGHEQVRAGTKRPEVVQWLSNDRTAVAIASITNASGPSAIAGLLDMIVYATLKRISIEEHWGPTLLKDETGPVLAAYRRAERVAWDAARRILKPEQVEQLWGLIEEWRKANPTQFYVSHIRFSEFAKYRGITSDSPEAKLPGNLFGVFYMDPLAGIDPVVREAHEYRMLLERMNYMALRMPIILAWQFEVATLQLTGTPEMRQVVYSAEMLANATASFAKSAAEFPAALAVERKAALDQAGAILAAEREAAIKQVTTQLEDQRSAIVKDLNQQEQALKGLLKDVSNLIAQTDQMGKSVNTSTAETVGKTQVAAAATVDRVFTWAVALAVLLLVGVPLSAYVNRRARQRQTIR